MPRIINEDTVAWIDRRIGNATLVTDLVTRHMPRQLFIAAVRACIGVQELGNNDGPDVRRFQATVGLAPPDAWCMAFLQTCLMYAEVKAGIPSPVHASGGCVQVWQQTPATQRVQRIPLGGAIAIWQHTQDPTHGHTGMVIDCDGEMFHDVEGNTTSRDAGQGGVLGNRGGARPSQGVFLGERHYDLARTYSGDMKLLGCLKPF